MKVYQLVHTSAAIKGFLYVLPFFVVNLIVGLRIEPLYSLLGAIPLIRRSPIIPLLLLLLFPIGAWVALRPIWSKNAQGKRTVYILNGFVAFVMLSVFLVIGAALGEEWYRCDVMKIPNCD